MTDDETREAVQDALDLLPDEFSDKIDNLAVIVEDDGTSRNLRGLYEQRMGMHQITIFRDTNPNRDEVIRTVLHEVGHYFGIGEAQLRELGYG
jgi:predicted Zn-dependent protease with MMP-like domain